MIVREALPTEAQAIADLVNSSYRGESSRFGWTTEAEFLDGSRISVKTTSEMIRPTFGQTILVLQEKPGDDILGCVYLEKTEESACYLGMLTVSPKLQDKGFGRLILNEAELYARRWGCPRMVLGVIQLRGTLMAWYERRGYRKTDVTQPFPYDQPENGIPKRPDLHFIMFEKDLPPL